LRYGSHIVPISCSLPRAWIKALDEAAQVRKVERIELLRDIIGAWLAETHSISRSPENNNDCPAR
jgi:metal-responsive CopG/Arc/MetJ family transcriptional regulator